MTQTSEKIENPFSLIDLEHWNPWWENKEDIPPKSYHRSDLYWRVKNTLAHDILLIPGAPVTGTGQTLKQIARALILGTNHESDRIQELFHSPDEATPNQDSIPKTGCDPMQICYANCTDPLAHLVEDYANEVRRSYHKKVVGNPQLDLDFYLFLEDIHRLDSWREQLVDTHRTVQQELPENWTVVATLPTSRLAYKTDFTDLGDTEIGTENIDLPHYTQKFRNTLFSATPDSALRQKVQSAGEEETVLARTRNQIQTAATGKPDPDALVDVLNTLHRAIRDTYTIDELRSLIGRYLTLGGFESALVQPEVGTNEIDSPRTSPQAQEIEAISAHINSGLERTLYQDVPRLAKLEDEIKRIEHPEELHAMIAFLARRSFTETTYIDLGEFLSCDTRTIRNKYVNILEEFHIGERATRYDLERNRSLRFYLRSPGYLTALSNSAEICKRSVSQDTWTKRLRLTIADHLRRLLPKYESDETLQYWRDDSHLVDYVLEIDGYPVSFISEFADETKGGTVAGMDAFNKRLEELRGNSEGNTVYHQPNLEVVITDADRSVNAKVLGDSRIRLTLPHWLLLTIC